MIEGLQDGDESIDNMREREREREKGKVSGKAQGVANECHHVYQLNNSPRSCLVCAHPSTT